MLPFERETDEQKREEERKRFFFFFFFNLAGYIFKIKYSLDMLQCSPYLESYYSKSKKNLELERLLEGFFCVNGDFFLQKVGIASLLVML